MAGLLSEVSRATYILAPLGTVPSRPRATASACVLVRHTPELGSGRQCSALWPLEMMLPLWTITAP